MTLRIVDKIFPRKIFPVTVLALGMVLAFSGRAQGVALHAGQEQKSAPASGAPQAASEANSREANSPEVNPNDAFRHSDSVKAVARMTGLTVDQAYWLCVVVNFLIVAAVLGFLLKKTLPTAFRNRGEALQKHLEEARKSSEEARRRLSEVESRLARMDTEIAQMRQDADAAAHAEDERIQAAAEDERRRIVQSAEQEIALAANAARRELKAYAADLAVGLAEKKIQIGKSADQTLVREFTGQLGKDTN